MARPECLEHNLRTILRFWGARPKGDTHVTDPFHDLRLHHPIRDPIWIERFEAWMRGRGSSPQTRNHYRSVPRGMYETALLPAYRTASGISLNPFRDLPRETVVERTVTISIEDLRSWLKNASYHVRLAVAIAALAPKLRLANVLALTWKDGGATFHTLRHTAASLLAELGEPEAIRKEVMGHRDIATTQRYTHLRPVHEIPAHERLADAVPIADLVTAPRKRASGKGAGTNAGTLPRAFEETQGKTGPDRKLATTHDFG
jgi:integrase